MKTPRQTTYTRNRLAKVIALILMTSIVYGQELAGEWNGALTVQGNQIRLVFHVSKKDKSYSATMDSPDQGATGTTVTLTDFKYPKVKFEIGSLGAIYEGVMSQNTVTGKWLQSGTALFLILVRKEESHDNEK